MQVEERRCFCSLYAVCRRFPNRCISKLITRLFQWWGLSTGRSLATLKTVSYLQLPISCHNNYQKPPRLFCYFKCMKPTKQLRERCIHLTSTNRMQQRFVQDKFPIWRCSLQFRVISDHQQAKCHSARNYSSAGIGAQTFPSFQYIEKLVHTNQHPWQSDHCRLALIPMDNRLTRFTRGSALTCVFQNKNLLNWLCSGLSMSINNLSILDPTIPDTKINRFCLKKTTGFIKSIIFAKMRLLKKYISHGLWFLSVNSAGCRRRSYVQHCNATGIDLCSIYICSTLPVKTQHTHKRGIDFCRIVILVLIKSSVHVFLSPHARVQWWM